MESHCDFNFSLACSVLTGAFVYVTYQAITVYLLACKGFAHCFKVSFVSAAKQFVEILCLMNSVAVLSVYSLGHLPCRAMTLLFF